MRTRATLLTVVLVLSAIAAGTGGAFAATPDANGGEDVRTHAPRPKNATNDSSTAYRGIEASDEYLNKSVNLSTAPESFDSGDASAAADGGSDSIIMDPSDDDPAVVGTTKQYLGSDLDGYYFKNYTLLAVGDHVEVWVARNLSWPAGDPRTDPTISESQAEALRTQFERNIYPTESRVFGTPAERNGTEALLEKLGIVPENYYHTKNGSGKTVLLVDNVRDRNYYDPSYPLYIAGFYSPTIQQYTDRNAITIDAYGWDEVNETDRTVGYEGTLAHEYQHLIHNDLDGDETTWVNEGMSDYAEYITGYGVPEEHVQAFERMPYGSLTGWEDLGAINVLADYGHAFVWTMYLDDRYGTDFVSNLAEENANGVTGVRATLDEVGAKTDFYGLYQDFSTAVVTDDVSHPPKDAYHVDGVELHVNTTSDVGTAAAWGTAYETYDVEERGPVTDVTVSGTEFTETEWRTATDPVDGQGQVLYSGSGNLLDRFAVVRANLSGTENPKLTFETYYDIEENWDYGFVQVSTDGGETWHSLRTERMDGTPNPSAHPTVTANLPGYTGESGGWVSQSVDLSAYEDEGRVLVAFRYTTDWAFEQPGWYVRNVSVAGESVPTDTVEPYMSLREAQNASVEYQFTFVGVKANGNYEVKQLDVRTFTESEERELKRFLHNGNFERVVVASTWAARPGEDGRVPVGVELAFADESQGNDGADETDAN